jgi:hypothetical protein
MDESIGIDRFVHEHREEAVMSGLGINVEHAVERAPAPNERGPYDIGTTTA